MGVFKNMVADPKIFRNPTEIFELQWLSFAGKVIERSCALGFEDSLFSDTPKKAHAELLSTAGSSISSGGFTCRNIKKNVMSLRNCNPPPTSNGRVSEMLCIM